MLPHRERKHAATQKDVCTTLARIPVGSSALVVTAVQKVRTPTFLCWFITLSPASVIVTDNGLD